MGRKYTGWDRNSSGKRAGTEKFIDLLEERFGLWNNGSWMVRNKRGKTSASVHGTGRAFDLSWRGGKYRGSGKYEDACALIDFVVDNADALGVEAVFDYYPKPWGRGWKCDRNRWNVYTARAFKGAPGGDWVHIEISNEYADNPEHYEKFFAKSEGKKPAAKAPAKTESNAPKYPGRSLRKGSKGLNVERVQRVVDAYVDGDFGPKTERAVKKWQRANKSCCGPSDGIVGPKTWGCMFPR